MSSMHCENKECENNHIILCAYNRLHCQTNKHTNERVGQQT